MRNCNLLNAVHLFLDNSVQPIIRETLYNISMKEDFLTICVIVLKIGSILIRFTSEISLLITAK